MAVLSGVPGDLYRFEHEFAGCVVGADGDWFAPKRLEAPARLVEQRLANHGDGVGELRRGAGVQDGQCVGQAAAAQKLEPAQLVHHEHRVRDELGFAGGLRGRRVVGRRDAGLLRQRGEVGVDLRDRGVRDGPA